MEAFENIIGRILEQEGYWVRYSYKVCLEDSDKVRIAKPNCPAWDLDIVAYSGAKNRIRVVECKSYLGSTGVRYESLANQDSTWSMNFKLFNDAKLRDVVFERLKKQLMQEGSCAKKPDVELCLAAGKISNKDRSRLKDLFSKRRWVLLDKDWIVEKLLTMNVSTSYHNDVTTIVLKLIAERLKTQPSAQA